MKKQKKESSRKFFLKIGILILLLLLLFLGYKYLTYSKEQSYLQGGRDAINHIINVAKQHGGLTLTLENETITIAHYNKETSLNETEFPEEDLPSEETYENSSSMDTI
jgi:hypothetical protein